MSTELNLNKKKENLNLQLTLTKTKSDILRHSRTGTYIVQTPVNLNDTRTESGVEVT